MTNFLKAGMQLSSGLLPKQYPRDSLQKDIQDRILYKIYITLKKEKKEKCLDVTEKANPWRKKIKLYVSMFKT